MAESARHLAAGIAGMRMLVDPEIVVLGGRVGLAPGYREAVQDSLARTPTGTQFRVARVMLGPEASVVGAADLVARVPDS